MKTILCFNADPELEVNRREFDGVRRFADTCGWRLLFVNGESSLEDSASSLVARHRPDGCIVGPNTLRRTLPARVFGKTPVVWLVPQNEVGREYEAVSLGKFRRKFQNQTQAAAVLHVKNLKVENGITYLPLYMAPLLVSRPL